jgi:hypothetical protein
LWAFYTGDFNHFVLALFLVQLGVFAATAPINSAILASVPGKMAATAFALSIFLIHALGDVISPPLVGYFADHMPMPRAMLILVLALGLSGIIWQWAAKDAAKT